MKEEADMDWQSSVFNKERFEFGKNWMNYNSKISYKNVEAAKKSMNEFLPSHVLRGKSFLDIGSGSGLHSLVATSDGAYVTSFDFDPFSVEATQSLKSKFSSNNTTNWRIFRASILDPKFLATLPKFDIVYSWGVLHHTGEMWTAISNAINLVKDDGYLFIAIYNNQGWKSKFWWYIKLIYNKIPKIVRKPWASTVAIMAVCLNIIKYTLLLKPKKAILPLLKYNEGRGMSWKTDFIDWIGGFPYEFATVEELEVFINPKGFIVEKVKRSTSLGCNEILFKRISSKNIAKNC
jgi:2-polyprenyl-6-hydroxyphenyl methylase/3-demethylubiquinone-9 3-methyltransferase